MNVLAYRDGTLFNQLFRKFEPFFIEKRESLGRKFRFMEVCGTHTVSFSKTGVRDLLSPYIDLTSGPGCPVCVTDQADIDQMIAYAKKENVIITTFGDMMKVPGTRTNLYKERAEGADIRVVYSASQALQIAQEHPHKQVLLLGVGFETTAPSIALSIMRAKDEGVKNFFVYAAHKLTPPAVKSLINDDNHKIDGFILPGHVSVIIGREGWRLLEEHQIPAVISGFEPIDLLTSTYLLTKEMEQSDYTIKNNYTRNVKEAGNEKAKSILEEVFTISSPKWRGFGSLPFSGMEINSAYEEFDASKRILCETPKSRVVKGCRCGEIVKGKETPFDCKLFGKACNPDRPLGPCMVSSEGTCSTYFNYERANKKVSL
ncbi:hydrogenase formation protein HypD [Thalassobacillus hwangdonensis]|uniref:Hydrogenase formation protein HypD n=1 Tax=Thalassobacillus hwangdonensis TaxID=546108 RepID=A0ABW3KXU5_9BACI